MEKRATSLSAAAWLAAVVLVPVASGAGPAFTGVAATADTAETAASNPAGMARLEKSSFYGSPMVVFTTSETEFMSQNLGSGSVKSDSVILVPGFYYVRPLNEKWAIGIGPSGASGLGSSYGDDWAGRYLLDEWSLVFAGLAPSVSYRVNEKLSLGVSVPLTYSKFSLSKAVFNGPGEKDGRMEFDADGFGVGVTVGILYEIDRFNRVGITYNSPVSIKQEGRPEFSDLSPAREAVLNTAGVLDQDVTMDSTRPQFVVAGYFHDFGNGWSATADGVWIDYSEMGVSDIVLGTNSLSLQGSNYQDVLGCSLGAQWRYNSTWAYKVGAGYLSAPLKEEDRTVFSRTGETFVVGVGAEYATGGGRVYALDISYLQFSDGRFSVKNAPGAGDISGEYSTNYGIAIGFSTQW